MGAVADTYVRSRIDTNTKERAASVDDLMADLNADN